LVILLRLPIPPLFPYTTLFRSRMPLASQKHPVLAYPLAEGLYAKLKGVTTIRIAELRSDFRAFVQVGRVAAVPARHAVDLEKFVDRKSTRLNSSHVKISYAVFC